MHPDTDLTVARPGPHDGGAGRVADVPREPEVGEHPAEGITIKYHSCGEVLRQNAERAGKALTLRRYRPWIPTSRPRTSACGSAAPTAGAEADAHPGEETAREGLRRRERSARDKTGQMSLRTIIGIFTAVLRTRKSLVAGNLPASP